MTRRHAGMSRYYLVFLCVLLLAPVGDTLLIRRLRRGSRPGRVIERWSLPLLWLGLGAGMAAALWLKRFAAFRIGAQPPALAAVAVAFMLSGMALRWAAMRRLGNRFSPHVELGGGQALVTEGVFRLIRHPAYSGILLIFFGVGLTYASWLSLAAVAIAAAAGVANRVRIEEKALREEFGPAYEEYAGRSRRFIPFVL